MWKLEKRYCCLYNSGTNKNITWASSGWKVDKLSVSSLISQWGEQNIIILTSLMDLCVWIWMINTTVERLLAAFTWTLPFDSVRNVACYFNQTDLSFCIFIIPKYVFKGRSSDNHRRRTLGPIQQAVWHDSAATVTDCFNGVKTSLCLYVTDYVCVLDIDLLELAITTWKGSDTGKLVSARLLFTYPCLLHIHSAASKHCSIEIIALARENFSVMKTL